MILMQLLEMIYFRLYRQSFYLLRKIYSANSMLNAQHQYSAFYRTVCARVKLRVLEVC